MKRFLLAACLLVPLPAAAEALATLHWVGREAATAAGYEGSRTEELVGLMEPEQLADAAERVKRALLLRADDPDLVDGVELAGRLGGVSFEHPVTAWAAAGPDGEGFAGAVQWAVPDPATRGRLEVDLRGLLRETGSPRGWSVSQEGPTVRLAYGEPGSAPAQGDDEPAVLSLEVGVAALVALGEQTLRAEAPPDATEAIDAVLGVLEPGGIQRLSLRQGFEDGSWRTTLRVDAPQPRAGLAALLVDAPALEDADLEAIPADAPVVAAFGFDVAAAWKLAREAVAAADDQAAQQLDEALVAARDATGVDIEADLLEAFGPAHVLFQDPAVAGDSMLGFVAVNRLRDADRFAGAMASLLELANGLVEAQTRDLPVSGRAFVTGRGGVAVTTIPLPGLAPSYAVMGDRLVVGLYPQTLIAMIDREEAGGEGGGGGGSILDTPAFAEPLAAGRERSGGGGVTSVSFVDLPRLAPQAYGSMLVLEHVGTGLASMASREPVPAVLPPFARVRPLLAPATGVGWSTPEGAVSESLGPFPGASMLGGGGGGGASSLFMLPGILTGAWSAVEDGLDGPSGGYADEEMDLPIFEPPPPAPPAPPAPGSVPPPPPSPF